MFYPCKLLSVWNILKPIYTSESYYIWTVQAVEFFVMNKKSNNYIDTFHGSFQHWVPYTHLEVLQEYTRTHNQIQPFFILLLTSSSTAVHYKSLISSHMVPVTLEAMDSLCCTKPRENYEVKIYRNFNAKLV